MAAAANFMLQPQNCWGLSIAFQCQSVTACLDRRPRIMIRAKRDNREGSLAARFLADHDREP